MTFIDDNELEIIGRELQIITELNNLGVLLFFFSSIPFIFGIFTFFVGELFTCKNCKKFLNGGNNDISFDICILF